MPYKCPEKRKAYGKANAEKIKEYHKEYYKANAEKIKEYKKANAEKIKEYKKANAEKIKEYEKANAEKIKEYKRKYQKANAEKIKEYKKAHPELSARSGKKIRERIKFDPTYVKDPKHQQTTVHGHAGTGERTSIYTRWCCTSARNRKMKLIYKPWDASHNPDAFVTFLADVGDETEHGKKLCRIDTADGYHPDNLEWR